MDIAKLRQEYSKLLEYLQTKGYSNGYIKRIKKMLKLLFEKEGSYASYEEFFEKFVFPEGLNSVKQSQKQQRIAIRVIHAFDELGRFRLNRFFLWQTNQNIKDKW